MTTPRQEWSRPTVGRLMVWVAMLGLFLSIATPVLVRVWDRRAYFRVQVECFDLIAALRAAGLATVSPTVWENAGGWARTAYGNVCFSESHVTFAELVRFRDDLRAKLREGPADLRTIKWTWDRLGQTGLWGEEYTHRHEPAFRAWLPPGM